MRLNAAELILSPTVSTFKQIIERGVTRVSPYSLPGLLAFAINISFATVAFLDDPRSSSKRRFALLIGCFALWDAADILLVNTKTSEAAALGAVITVAAVLFGATFFLLLSFSFPRPIAPHLDTSLLRSLYLAPPAVFTAVAGSGFFTPFIVQRDNVEGAYALVGSYSAGYSGFAMAGIVFVDLAWGIVNYLGRMRASSTPSERRQVGSLLLGLLSVAVLAALVQLPRISPELLFVAQRVLLFLVGMLFAALVLGNRLMVFGGVSRQRLMYSVAMGLVFALYIVMIVHIAQVVAGLAEDHRIIIETVLIVLLAVIFRPLVVRLQSLIGRSLSEQIFQYRQKFSQFTQDSFRLTSMAALARSVDALVRELLSGSSADILLSEDSGDDFRSVLDPSRSVNARAILPQLSSRERLVLDTEDLTSTSPGGQEIFGGAPVSYIAPLHAERGLTGVLLVGPSASGRALTSDERDFLAIVANGVSMAVERITLLEKMRADEVRVEKMEKLAFLGRLTAGIAHEFRNPLNIISTAAQTIVRHPQDVELHRETGEYIVEETDRLSRTIEEFLQFAKPHTPTWERAVIGDMVGGSFDGLESLARGNGVAIEIRIDPSLPEIVTSPGHIQRILYNLGLNAIEAMPHGGMLTVEAHAKGREAVTISVSDTGPGIPAEHHVRLFDPFFTTKARGTGLGLAIVFMLVQSVKGKITFTSSTGGTRFVLELPKDGSTV